MKQIKIDNQHGIGLTLDRVTTTIVDSNGTHRGDDEIILYVPDASDYDTDFIQGNCAMLCFSPAQAIRLARRLLRLAGKAKKHRRIHAAYAQPKIVTILRKPQANVIVKH